MTVGGHASSAVTITGSAVTSLPRITVVTPVLNGAAHIAETLESVLRQEYPELEYIVADGGSTDETLDIIRRYENRNDLPQRISRVLSGPDQGMYDAIAKGFEQASGDIYCYLNADDLFECGGLRTIGEYFSRHPETQVIYYEDVVHVDGWKFPNVRQPEGVGTFDLLKGHILFQDGVFWRRSIFEAVGGIRRDLKLAGDFDLWLRLSNHASFVRRSGHVSCFRMLSGQLSSRMDRYHREMEQSIADFLATKAASKRALWAALGLFWGAYRKLTRARGNERLFFPIDFGELPPPAATTPPGLEEIPRSPIDGKPAERLLFTAPDTRFGERELSYIYLDERHGIAITHPHITAERLDELYRRHYSSPPTEIVPPEAASPYRRFCRKRRWEKVLYRLPVGILSRILFPAAESDNTLHELITVLEQSKVDTSRSLSFLDVGCFEGHLLDQIRRDTPWAPFGLEPNSRAVDAATKKGLRVWCGHAVDAGSLIPVDQRFDIIHLGQSIEHMDDPVNVLVHLRCLLSPDGVLVLSTPNLDSREIDWFGPTWAHWHPPYHRYIFSGKGLHALAKKAGLLPVCLKTFSNPYWTSMSLAQNQLGLGGSVSHAVRFDSRTNREARRIHFWKRILWDRLDKGDYCLFAMKDDIAGDPGHA